MINAKFSCIYCDDVRREDGGKSSYMGVYEDSIIFSEPSGHRPLFAFILKLVLPIKEDISDVNFELTDDSNLNIGATLSKKEIQELKIKILASMPDSDVVTMKCVIQLGAIVFESQQKIRSFVKFNDQTIEGESLRVIFMNPDQEIK